MKKDDTRGVRAKDGFVHRVFRIVKHRGEGKVYDFACGGVALVSWTAGRPGTRTGDPVNCFGCIASKR